MHNPQKPSLSVVSGAQKHIIGDDDGPGMDAYWLAEVAGAALACAVAAAVTLQVVAGTMDLMLVAGIAMVAGIAAAANRQARTRHSDLVADEAPIEESPEGSPEGSDGDD